MIKRWLKGLLAVHSSFSALPGATHSATQGYLGLYILAGQAELPGLRVYMDKQTANRHHTLTATDTPPYNAT